MLRKRSRRLWRQLVSRIRPSRKQPAPAPADLVKHSEEFHSSTPTRIRTTSAEHRPSCAPGDFLPRSEGLGRLARPHARPAAASPGPEPLASAVRRGHHSGRTQGLPRRHPVRVRPDHQADEQGAGARRNRAPHPAAPAPGQVAFPPRGYARVALARHHADARYAARYAIVSLLRRSGSTTAVPGDSPTLAACFVMRPNGAPIRPAFWSRPDAIAARCQFVPSREASQWRSPAAGLDPWRDKP
jgi:hypothetical protein